jgi:hypothetical protein
MREEKLKEEKLKRESSKMNLKSQTILLNSRNSSGLRERPTPVLTKKSPRGIYSRYKSVKNVRISDIEPGNHQMIFVDLNGSSEKKRRSKKER